MTLTQYWNSKPMPKKKICNNWTVSTGQYTKQIHAKKAYEKQWIIAYEK